MTERERLVQQLIQSVMDDSEIGRFCDRYARQQSGTQFWSAEDFEANEQSAQYELYWANYARVQGQLVIDAGMDLVGLVGRK